MQFGKKIGIGRERGSCAESKIILQKIEKLYGENNFIKRKMQFGEEIGIERQSRSCTEREYGNFVER